MEILQWSGLFVLSLAALIYSADHFTNNAEKIGIYYGISPFIIGVTIVALGTSLPELATSIIAVFQEHSEVVIGNVVGSNMANIMLVLAISAIVGKHLLVNKDIVKIDLPLLLGSSILLFFTTLDAQFDYIDGILSLFALFTYLIYNAKSHRQIDRQNLKHLAKLKREEQQETLDHKLPIRYPIILLVSGFFLYLSADWTIKSVVELAGIFKIGTEIIAISAIAVGTSLPELVVSVVAVKKNKADLAIGNVTGSNIFNVLGVMGIPALFGSLTIPPEFISFTIPALLLVTILYVFTTMDKEISQWEGISLLLLYIAFMGKTFGVI